MRDTVKLLEPPLPKAESTSSRSSWGENAVSLLFYISREQDIRTTSTISVSCCAGATPSACASATTSWGAAVRGSPAPANAAAAGFGKVGVGGVAMIANSGVKS